jgi:hypothetical protein
MEIEVLAKDIHEACRKAVEEAFKIHPTMLGEKYDETYSMNIIETTYPRKSGLTFANRL